MISLFTFAQAHAIGSVSGAKVTSVRVDLNGEIMVFFDKPIGGTPPTCVHNAYNNAFAADTKAAGSSAVLAWALTAKSTGANVTVYGMGVCGVYGGTNVETWSYGVIY